MKSAAPSSRFVLSIALVFAGLLLMTPQARAELMIFGEETGGDVVFTFSGTIDTTGANGSFDFLAQTHLSPTDGRIEAWQAPSDGVTLGLDAAVPFGTGDEQTDVGAGSGDNIALFGKQLFIDDAYVSGSPFNATLTFANTDFATLGVDDAAGPYLWTVTGNRDTIVMRFPVVVDNSVAKAALLKTIKKLQKKSKKLKKKGKKAKAKKLLKKVKKLQAQLAALG